MRTVHGATASIQPERDQRPGTEPPRQLLAERAGSSPIPTSEDGDQHPLGADQRQESQQQAEDQGGFPPPGLVSGSGQRMLEAAAPEQQGRASERVRYVPSVTGATPIT